MSTFKYEGSELNLFSHAKNFKKYYYNLAKYYLSSSEHVLEVGADDFDIIGEEAYVSIDQGKLITAKKGLEELGYGVKSAEIIMTPNSLQKIETSDKEKVLELMDLIDNHDDVNQVYSNFSVSE